jgi:hypothetical protein
MQQAAPTSRTPRSGGISTRGSRHEADESEVLNGLLLNPQWMQRKLEAVHGPMPLASDYEKLVHDRSNRKV